MKGVKKINVDLLQYSLREKEVNSIRYYIALRIYDRRGEGRLEVSKVKPKLAVLFGVSPKTVSNNLSLLQDKGIGNLDNGYFYYKCIEEITLALGSTISSKAVEVELNDIRGGIVKSRAFFEKAFLATVRHNITRENIGERLGLSRKTQLKYEGINGVEPTKLYSFVDLGKFNEHYLKSLRHTGEPVFAMRRNNELRLYRQIGNRYEPDIKVVKRRVRKKDKLSHKTPKATVKRLFHDNPEQAYSYWSKNDTAVDALYPIEGTNDTIFGVLHNKKEWSIVGYQEVYESNIDLVS